MFASLLLRTLLGLGLAGPGPTPTTILAQPVGGDVVSEYEQLEGFVGVVVKQINAIFGTERLPAAPGFPVEPGVYVTLAPNQMLIFDKVGTTLSGGMPADQAAAAECKSGCSRAFFDAFRVAWLDMQNEAQAVEAEVPIRVLFGAEAGLPARALVDAAYAASEARPGVVPNLYILLNGGPAGLRARNFFLVPPGGLAVSPARNPLGLTVDVMGGGRFEVKAADSRLLAPTTANGSEAFDKLLVGLDRRFPSKDVLILRPGPNALVADLVQVMTIASDRFPIIVFDMNQGVRVGG